ncbi:MAG: branched-chain amino acid ABC transporter permease [Clostridiales Family XIII bacterium]|jgi:branched-chain amino acid transport system permease protein|nr:branched-chain amino acid ABC transporter permease [Clostridiales Family XIII bacterium]
METINKRKNLNSACALAVLFLVVILMDQLIRPTDSMAMLLTVIRKGSIYALVAVSMNLLNGFTGLFSLGQAGFMLLGAYTYAIFTIPLDERVFVYKYYDYLISVSFPEVLGNLLGGFGLLLGVILALILAGLVAAGVAFLIGLPVLRLKSDYLAIATLGFAEIIRAIFIWGKLGPLTNGSNPLKSYVRLNAFQLHIGDTTINFSTLVPLAFAAFCIWIIVLLVNSSYGRAFKAIREDEIAAEAMGINLYKHKQLSFVISSFFAGVGGAMLAMFASTVQANNFKSTMTYEILLIVILGGIGSISGSCIGSFLFIAASEWWLRGLDSGTFLGIDAPGVFRNGFRLVVFSLIIMSVVLFFRRGIMGDKEIPEVMARIWGRLRTRMRGRAGKGGEAADG